MAPERESCGAASSPDMSAGALPPVHPVGEEQVKLFTSEYIQAKFLQESTNANLQKQKTESEVITASADFQQPEIAGFCCS